MIRPVRHVVEAVRNRENPGLPWWSRGKESTCQCRGHGSHPWSRRLPCAAGQLSPCATTTSWYSATREGTARRSLCATRQSSPHVQQQRPSLAKNKNKLKNFFKTGRILIAHDTTESHSEEFFPNSLPHLFIAGPSILSSCLYPLSFPQEDFVLLWASDPPAG